MKISLIHPSRSRPEKSIFTIDRWLSRAFSFPVELIVSVDEDDPSLELYKQTYQADEVFLISKNRSCVDAINNAARVATGDIFIVVSDDTSCEIHWDTALLKEVEGETDWILKTEDGIQPHIITMPCMDRAYYNRTGYIYHPDFEHMFCDTYMTCVADITGRKITSNLLFKHLNDTIKDDLRKRTDGTWQQGQDTFIRLMKQFSKADIQKIQDRQMIRFLRNNGVQV
jgi:glycosyltransferase involved in cell wall biosynthesis